MWVEVSKWAEDLKIFVSHVNVHQKVTSPEEDFSNQVDRILYRGQPVCLATPIVTKWANEQTGYGGRDTSYAWVHQHELSLIKSDLAMITTECPICQ
jgi:hypothetical protein